GTRTVSPKLFTGSLFQFSSVTAAPAFEQSIGVSTIASDASTGSSIPASLTGAVIQSRIIGEKFHGNLPVAVLDDFTYDSPGNQVKCTTVPLLTVRRTIAGELSSKRATTSRLTEFTRVSRGPQAIASTAGDCTLPSGLRAPRFGMSALSRSGLCALRRLAIMVDGSSYRSIAPAFEIATSVPPASTQVANPR